MNKRIVSLVMCFVIVISLLGAGCDTNSNVAEQSSSEYLDESVITTDEQEEIFTSSTIPSEFMSSDVWEEAPEDEKLVFPDDGFGAYFPSEDDDESNVSQNSSFEEDVFDIDTIPSFDFGFGDEDATSSFNTNSQIVSSKPSFNDEPTYEAPGFDEPSYTPSSSSEPSYTPPSSSEPQYTPPSSSAPTVTKPIYLNKSLSFLPLTANYDGILDNNPDRGYRTEFVLYIKENKSSSDDPRTAYINDSQSAIRKSLEKIFKIYFKDSYSTNKTFL